MVLSKANDSESKCKVRPRFSGPAKNSEGDSGPFSRGGKRDVPVGLQGWARGTGQALGQPPECFPGRSIWTSQRSSVQTFLFESNGPALL